MRSPRVLLDHPAPAVDDAATHWLKMMAAFGISAGVGVGAVLVCWGVLRLLRIV